MSPVRRMSGRVVAAVLGALAMAVAVSPPGLALWTQNESASASYSTATVPPPTGPTMVRESCIALTSASLRISWTGSTADWVTGYRVSYGLTSGGPYTASVDVDASSQSTVLTGLGFSLPWYAVVTATRGAWSSIPTGEVTATTPSALCG